MKLKRVKRSLNEAIENIGEKAEDWGDTYKDVYDPIPEAVMPVSFVAAVEATKRWREEANKKLGERRKLALSIVEADDEDRFKHMDSKEEKFNKTGKLILSESLNEDNFSNPEIVKIKDNADKLLIQLAMVNFHDWQQLALDLLDSMNDAEIDKFISDYNYEVETPGVQFEKEEPVKEELKENLIEELLNPENIDDFKPWNGAVPNWEKIQFAGKLENLKYLVSELYPDGIEDQTLNDLLWFDFDFLKEVLQIEDEEVQEEEEGEE